MADFDEDNRRLTIKIVYYGPALAGKTSNLLSLYNLLDPESRGQIMTLDTRNDRTLFFDLLPIGIQAPSGLRVKLKLFTVPGQVAHESTRKAMLSHADGVVFVADSQRNQMAVNDEAFRSLADNVGRVNLDLETLPLVVQYNKRDLPDILSEQEIRKRWPELRWPLTFSSAGVGSGVLETLGIMVGEIYPELDRRYQLRERHGLERERFISAIIARPAGQQATA